MDWQLKVLIALALPNTPLDLSDVPQKYQEYISLVGSLPNVLEYKNNGAINTTDVIALLTPLGDNLDPQVVKDTINGHLFLEKLIIFNKPLAGLSYLRQIRSNELKAILSPLIQNSGSTKGTVFQKWNWGAHIQNSTQSRLLLRENLLKLLPSDIYVATDRLQSVVSDGLKYQNISLPSLECNSNLLHGNLSKPIMPSTLKYTLTEHTDEVWFSKYSPNGKLLATASKDSKVIIYNAMENYSPLEILQNHSSAVTYLSWSHDSQILLSLSFDQTVCLWSVADQSLFYTIEKDTLFDTPVRFTCAQFIESDHNDNGNYKFVLASSDGKLVIINANSAKINIIHQYKPKDTIPPQIHDLAILNDSIWTIQPNNTDLLCYSMPDLELTSVTALPATPTSIISLTNSSYLLLNFKSHSAILMNVNSQSIGTPYPETLFRLPPSANTPFIVRGCIGYSPDNRTEPSLVLSGSKTGQVWIWGASGNIITVVKGHNRLVNCLSWRPGYIEWASASDDHKICIWGCEET